MARFTLSGSRWRRHGLATLIGGLFLAITISVVITLDRQRATPNLSRISQQYAQLEQARKRLEALPPVHPIHWQMQRLHLLAKVLPGVHEMRAIEADPNLYPEAVGRKIGSFGGTVWKVALQGSFTSVIWLCRTAQPLMPIIVDSIQAGNGTAHAVLFVLGADPVTTGRT